MTMSHTNSSNAPKHVKISSSSVIKQPLHFALMDEKWFLKIWCKGSQNVSCSYIFYLLIARTLE